MFKKELFTDIRFWIILFFVIRLYGITNPPLEIAHNWRQVTVNMVTRNFLEKDASIIYPRIDMAGEKTGITGMEFPVLNYLSFISAKVFGFQHWYGRLINLIVSSFGLWFFYKLLRKYFSYQLAFNATIILAVSIWFQFSRKIMPDTFSVSLLISSIYYGTQYLEQKSRKYNWLYLIISVLLMTIGVLAKLPVGYLLIVYLALFMNKSISLRHKIIFAFASILGLFPVFYWYFIWVPFLVERYGFWHFFMGKGLKEGFLEVINNMGEAISKFYDTALKFIGFAVFVFGLVVSIVKNDRQIYLLFLLVFLGFTIVMFKGGYTFANHSYYIVPFVPIMAFVAGYGLTQIKKPIIVVVLLSLISIEGIANQQHDFRLKEHDMKLLNLEKDLDQLMSRKDLIVMNSGNFPTPLYFAHRKGWSTTNDQLLNPSFVETIKGKGLKYIVILKRSFGTDILLNTYVQVFDNEDYRVYKISETVNAKK